MRNKSGSPYVILPSKNFFRALPVHSDPEIRISGSGLVPRALKFFLLTKIIYGLPLLLITFFDLALTSRGYSADPWDP